MSELTDPRIPTPKPGARRIGTVRAGDLHNTPVPIYKDRVVLGALLGVATAVLQAFVPVPEGVTTALGVLATTIVTGYAINDARTGTDTVVGRLTHRAPRGCAPAPALVRLALGLLILATMLTTGCLREAAPLGRTLFELGFKHGRACIKKIGAEIVAYSPAGNYTAVCEFECDGRVLADQPCDLFENPPATRTPQSQ
jgi:hypothetical protein